MFSQTFRLSNYSRQNLIIWWALALQAGIVNVGGFMACHRFVTHTTGFATFFGVEIAQLQFGNAIGMLAVPLFYLVGAMYSGFFIDRRLAREKPANYTLVVGTMAGILLLVTSLGISGVFGAFGSPLEISKDFFLLAMLCLASGMQNASVTSASGAVLRTTHLTGLTTDLGIGLVTGFFESNPEKKEIEARKNKIRIGLMLSFIFGSMLGALSFSNFQYWGFLLPTLISLSFFLLAFSRRNRIKTEFHA